MTYLTKETAYLICGIVYEATKGSAEARGITAEQKTQYLQTNCKANFHPAYLAAREVLASIGGLPLTIAPYATDTQDVGKWWIDSLPAPKVGASSPTDEHIRSVSMTLRHHSS